MTEPTPAIEQPKPPAAPATEPKPEPVKPADEPKLSQVERDLHEMKLRNARLEAIADYEHLSKQDYSLIGGSTPEEAAANAKALNDRYASFKTPPDPNAPKPPVVQPGATQPLQKAFPQDDVLSPVPTGNPGVQDIARRALTHEDRLKIAEEATQEGRALYAAGGPRVVNAQDIGQ